MDYYFTKLQELLYSLYKNNVEIYFAKYNHQPHYVIHISQVPLGSQKRNVNLLHIYDISFYTFIKLLCQMRIVFLT